MEGDLDEIPQYVLSKGKGNRVHTYFGRKLETSYKHRILDPFADIMMSLNSDLPILDLASGQGESADYLDEHGLKTVRLDISKASGSFQKEKMFTRSNMEKLPFKNEAFSGIHFKDALVHVGDKDSFFREAARVLIPDGYFVLTTADNYFGNTSRDGMKYYPIIFSQIVKSAKEAGLELANNYLWTPKDNKTDWYNLFKRTRGVMVFQKNTDFASKP